MMRLHVSIIDQRIGTSDLRASPAHVQRVPKQAFPSTQSFGRRQVGPALAGAAPEGSFYPTSLESPRRIIILQATYHARCPSHILLTLACRPLAAAVVAALDFGAC